MDATTSLTDYLAEYLHTATVRQAVNMINGNIFADPIPYEHYWGLAIHYWDDQSPTLQSFQRLLQELVLEEASIPDDFNEEEGNPQIILRKIRRAKGNTKYYKLVTEIGTDQVVERGIVYEGVQQILEFCMCKGYSMYDVYGKEWKLVPESPEEDSPEENDVICEANNNNARDDNPPRS